jgi:hypothetical protein
VIDFVNSSGEVTLEQIQAKTGIPTQELSALLEVLQEDVLEVKGDKYSILPLPQSKPPKVPPRNVFTLKRIIRQRQSFTSSLRR